MYDNIYKYYIFIILLFMNIWLAQAQMKMYMRKWHSQKSWALLIHSLTRGFQASLQEDEVMRLKTDQQREMTFLTTLCW